MTISFTQILIWIIIAAVVGVVGELIARRRAPDGIVGAILVGLLAIFLIVGVFHFQITGEPQAEERSHGLSPSTPHFCSLITHINVDVTQAPYGR